MLPEAYKSYFGDQRTAQGDHQAESGRRCGLDYDSAARRGKEIRMELDPELQAAELSPIIIEIRSHLAKLDRIDEIVDAVNSMRDAFMGWNQSNRTT